MRLWLMIPVVALSVAVGKHRAYAIESARHTAPDGGDSSPRTAKCLDALLAAGRNYWKTPYIEEEVRLFHRSAK